MYNDKTELVFILDKSGSMAGLEDDTIGGYNAFLRDQKKLEGECRITTVFFDHKYHLIHDRLDIQAVSPITKTDYRVGGATALLDAIGMTIHKIENVQKREGAVHKARRVMFVIITDGAENSSVEYELSDIKHLISKHRFEDDWQFIFLGANIDAVGTARNLGINERHASKYHADSVGVSLNFDAMSEAAAEFRTYGSLSPESLDEIKKDYERRS